jgi:diguanylate cyclase (GGDEF)-like protein
MVRLLQRSERLLQSALSDSFPPLMAVGSGDMVLLDAPEKAGDPELAMALHDKGVRMVLALPLRSEGGGPVQGAVSLMFDRHIAFSREQFAGLGSLAQFISFGLAMSELKHQNDALAGKLTQITTVDALTGAYNRRHGEGELDNEMRRARRYGMPLGVIAFDIDNFRSVNDIYGYPCGDQALRTVAQTVLGRLRTSDLLVRMRGEEFLIIATHTAAIDALKLAEKLRETIAGTELPGCEAVTISLGVAQAPGRGRRHLARAPGCRPAPRQARRPQLRRTRHGLLNPSQPQPQFPSFGVRPRSRGIAARLALLAMGEADGRR